MYAREKIASFYVYIKCSNDEDDDKESASNLMWNIPLITVKVIVNYVQTSLESGRKYLDFH